MATSRRASISGPIVFASVGVALSIALLVGWVFVVVENTAAGFAGRVWLIVLGVISLVTITTMLVLFAVFLVMRILEVNRQSRFIDSVTHELKSPLASLKLLLETIARPEVGPDQREELRQMMADDVERLSHFIDDVLTASRVMGALGPDPQPLVEVDVAAMAVACARTIERRHHLDPGTIRVDLLPGLVVTTDATALRTALSNLVDNAVKYSDDDALDVSIHGHAEGGRLTLEVRDRGIGIPADALERVFDRFYRVDGEAVRSRRGTGLGLYVARALVRGLGGRLRAESAGPGLGTTLRIELK